MAESLDDMMSELSELRGAVESLAARMEQMAGEGGGGGIPLPAAGAPDDVALVAPAGAPPRFVTDIEYVESSSGSSYYAGLWAHGRENGSSWSSEIVRYVPEEV